MVHTVMERRKSKRIKATATVGYSIEGSVYSALTYDLSTHGCMIQSEAGFLESGDELELNFGDDLLVNGQVVWVKQRNAGIKFKSPLSVLAAKKILFNVVGTGLQQAMRGTSARLVSHHIHPWLRWWPSNLVELERPKVKVASDGTVRYGRMTEALICGAWFTPFVVAIAVTLR